MERNWRRRMRRFFLLGIVFLGISGLLLTAARRVPSFGTWYAEHIYQALVASVGRFSGLFPFSLSELLLYGALAGLLVWALRHIRRPLFAVSGIFLFCSALLFLYTINCGINYYRRPFSSYLELETGKADADDLYDLCEWLTGKVNESRALMEADPNRGKNQGKKGTAAMEALAEQYPVLSGYYPRPKPVAVSWILSVQQCSGIYSPFTVEANYNRDMISYNIPHTICHELSHLRGFMREDEANFIGYLACLNAPFSDYNYSGYLMGWIYAGNALAEEDYEAYAGLYGMLAESVREELAENSRFWDRYEGRVAEAANQVNDAYLKANGQQDGVKTYGRVVDLMLADFLENR